MDWNSSILWGIIGLVGGLIISFIFFKLSKKQRKLSYSISTAPIIVKKISKISDLIIKYKGREIDNLSTSFIKIKNAGNDTLENTDFPELNKLSITTNGEFLVTSADEIEIKKSDKFMKITPSLIACDKIELYFDYLDPKNIISFSVFHTGDIQICGSIKNGKIINDSQLEKLNRYKRIIELIIPCFICIFFAIMASLFLTYSI